MADNAASSKPGVVEAELSARESLLPLPLEEGTDEFLCCFEPWDDTDMDMDLFGLCAELDPSKQLASARPADTSHTPEDGDSFPKVVFDLS